MFNQPRGKKSLTTLVPPSSHGKHRDIPFHLNSNTNFKFFFFCVETQEDIYALNMTFTKHKKHYKKHTFPSVAIFCLVASLGQKVWRVDGRRQVGGGRWEVWSSYLCHDRWQVAGRPACVVTFLKKHATKVYTRNQH